MRNLHSLSGNKLGKRFMAFGQVTESTDVAGFKRFIGVGSFKILAVNPNKAQLESIYGRTLDNEPEYLGETDVTIDGKTMRRKQIRIDFIIQTNPEKNNGIELIDKVSFFLVDAPTMARTGKVQVLNRYGESTYATPAFVEQGTVDSQMSWFNTEGLKKAYSGEVELISFIKSWLGIPIRSWRADGQTHEIENKDDAVATLENVAKYFKGDITELKSLVKAMPEQMVKILMGVKTTDEGRMYQNTFNRMFLKYRNTNYSRLASEVADAQANGAYPTTVFEVCPLKEYDVQATDFKATGGSTSAPTTVADPFAVEEDNNDLPF